MPQPEGRLPQVVKKKEGPMPELRKRRSCLALLGAFAMVASVLAVGASPVSAVPNKAEGAAKYSACVGPAAVDAGFTDVAVGSTHDAAINCIAYYGITRGTTATTFSPGQTISRWQLAVMLQRAAGPAGVDLPEASGQGFTDISGLSAAFQAAVNQMAELGVMAGTSSTTFDPDGIVSRSVIVEALAGFLVSAQTGPGGRALTRNIDRSFTLSTSEQAATAATNTRQTVDENFRDIGTETFSAYSAIRTLAEMGVVSGRSDGSFGPKASVTRGQAAAFITRALAHTNARPAGVTMQLDKTAVTEDEELEVSVSIRGNDFAPIDSAPVDFLTYPSKDAATAFSTDGTCNSGSGGVSAAAGGTGVCVIEIDDDATELDGNVSFAPTAIRQETVYVAWTGAVADKLDWDSADLSMDNSAVSNAATATVGTVTNPNSAKVSLSISEDAEDDRTARYGTTVTVTIQLQDQAGEDIAVPGRTYAWFATGQHQTDAGGTTTLPVLAGTGTRTVVTDSSGKATFTLTQADPVTTAGADNVDSRTVWTYTITAVTAGGVDGVSPSTNAGIGFTASGASGSGMVIFEDDAPAALAVSAEVSRRYTLVAAASGTFNVTVTGKVTDQYGNAIRGVDMYFDTDGDDTFACTSGSDPCTEETDITNRAINGTTRRTSRSGGTNRLTASFTAPGDSNSIRRAVYRVAADLNSDGDVADTGERADVLHEWAQPPLGFNADTGAATGDTTTNLRIAHVDLANNVILVESTRNSRTAASYTYSYDDETIFYWFRMGADFDNPVTTETQWITAADFERRWAAYWKWCLADSGCQTWIVDENGPNTGSRFAVAHYNSKTGPIVMHIGINNAAGEDYDPPSS